MSKETELRERLIDSTPNDYGIEREDLEELFEIDRMHENSSVFVKKYGGVQGLLNKLGLDEMQGVDSASVDKRQKIFGTNRQREKPSKSFLSLCCEQFEDTILRVLVAAAIVSLVVGSIENPEEGWIEGVAIVIAICLVVFVSAGNDYVKEKQFKALNSKREQRDITVRRDGKDTGISIFDLVVGDIAHIKTGEQMPCDAILIRSTQLKADESALTGEPDLMHKGVPTEADTRPVPFLISGSQIAEGNGVAIVGAVGMYSQQGKTKQKLEAPAEATPLQLKLEVIASDIGKVGLIVAILTFSVMMIGELMKRPVFDSVFASFVIKAFIVGVTIIVVAVPEGLPLAVTISLAYSVGKMKDENNLVRHLSACETMGGGNNICSDKTGTLTQNYMTVVKLWSEETMFQGVHVNAESVNVSADTKKYLCEGACLNATAFLEPSEDPNKRWKQSGSKTECALLQMCLDMGFDYKEIRDANPDRNVGAIPFSSDRKRMTQISQGDDGNYLVYVKGAAEIVTDKCGTYAGKNGGFPRADSAFKTRVQNECIQVFADQALRAICMAYKTISANDWNRVKDSLDDPEVQDDLESDLIFLGVVGIQDPVRPEVPGAVRSCQAAGITVRMVTGDNVNTAFAIAKDCNIVDEKDKHKRLAEMPDYTVMEGRHFREQVGGLEYPKDVNGKEDKTEQPIGVRNKEVFKQIAAHLKVLGRSTPEDKYILVTGLKELENVVAVTGDGSNDAPALKKSNVGFAMGIAGTEIAKEAADIIILDDNFSSIVVAVKWGRNIYDCIRKFLQFQLTVNVVAMFIAFIGGAVQQSSPLTSVQMLWVNLIMDTFASLALATEPPTDELLLRKPYKKDDYLITPVMFKNILGQGFYQIAVLLFILFIMPQLQGTDFDFLYYPSTAALTAGSTEFIPEHYAQYTILFNTFVLMQVFNEINARKLKNNEFNVFANFFNNGLFLFILILTIVVQWFIVEYGGIVMKTTPLSANEFAACAAVGAFSLIWGLIIKLLPEDMCRCILKGDNERVLSEEESEGSVVSSLRKKTRSNIKRTNTSFVK